MKITCPELQVRDVKLKNIEWKFKVPQQVNLTKQQDGKDMKSAFYVTQWSTMPPYVARCLQLSFMVIQIWIEIIWSWKICRWIPCTETSTLSPNLQLFRFLDDISCLVLHNCQTLLKKSKNRKIITAEFFDEKYMIEVKLIEAVISFSTSIKWQSIVVLKSSKPDYVNDYLREMITIHNIFTLNNKQESKLITHCHS